LVMKIQVPWVLTGEKQVLLNKLKHELH